MEMKFDEMLDRISKFMETEARTETVIGQPFNLGEFSCIPVIRVGLGFGSGGVGKADSKKSQSVTGGAGAGMGLEPIGFLVSSGDQISFVSTKTNEGFAAVFDKVPGLISKYLDTKSTEE